MSPTIYQEVPKLFLQQEICGLVDRTLAQQFKVQHCESTGFQDHQTSAEMFHNHIQNFGRCVRTEKNVSAYKMWYSIKGILSREAFYHPNPYIKYENFSVVGIPLTRYLYITVVFFSKCGALEVFTSALKYCTSHNAQEMPQRWTN